MVGLSASELPVETLFPGDTIEYFSMAFVAGDPRGHRVAKVLRVNRKDDELPIEVDTQEMLPLTIMLKRKRDRVDADISSDDAKWRKLRTFRLVDGEVEGETRADRLNAGLNKSLSDAIKSTKKKLAMEKQEESDARSKTLMQMFLTKSNAASDEDETTSSQRSVLREMSTPDRRKTTKLLSPRGNTDHHSSMQPHKFVSKKNHHSDKVSRRSRPEDETVQSEWKSKHNSKKHESRKRKRNVSSPTRPKNVDTTPRARSVSKYFGGKQVRRPKKGVSTDLSKFMNHVQETDDVEKIKEQKRLVWGLDEYYALDNKKKALEAENTGGRGHSRESSSNILVNSGKTAWSQQWKNYRKTNGETDALRLWFNPMGNDKRHGDLKEVGSGIRKKASNEC